MRQVIILGSGPAGLTAGVYAARAHLSPLIVDGHEPGGQLTLTTTVENFPGFPEGLLGPDLIRSMRQQAERFGAEFRQDTAAAVDLGRRPFRITIDGSLEECQSLIIATGASAKMLGFPSERQLVGHGVSTCATCDGFFFQEQAVMVVGGGDSALEEALFLTKFAKRVTVVHRRDKLRASKIMQEKAFANPKIDFLWDSIPEEILDVSQQKAYEMVGRINLRQVMEGRQALARVFPELAALLREPLGGCRGCNGSSVARAVLTFIAQYGKGRDLNRLAGFLPADFIKAIQDG